VISEEIDADELRSRQHGPLPTDGEGEFRCDACNARCTRSPTKDIEYGHRSRCPHRPDHFPYGRPVYHVEDPVATDGGEQR